MSPFSDTRSSAADSSAVDSFDAVVAEVTVAGGRFEIGPVLVDGVEHSGFVNAPATLPALLAASRHFGDRTFLVHEDERWSFAAVWAAADGLAAALVDRYGVQKGDRVAVAMRNLPEWIVTFAAVTSIGAISVSLNSWWTPDELDYALDDCGASVLVADAERARDALATCRRLGMPVIEVRGSADPADGVDRWDDVVEVGAPPPTVVVGPDDDATILYTSGTTGRPKGAVSTHRAVTSAVVAYACRGEVDRRRDPVPPVAAGSPSTPPVFILVVPLFHVTGCVPVMLSAFTGGLKLVMLYRWSPERALELIERERVTTFVGVPTQSWDLVHSPRFAEFDTSSLKRVGGGGAPAPPALVDRVATSFPRGGPTIGYGMTETNAYGPQNAGPDYLSHPTSAGRVVPIVAVEVRDPAGVAVEVGALGEIWFRGPNLIRGYWGKPEATAETIVDGWLRSGDIGRLDADGFVYVEDRVKDMILRGGENVYCAEVEAALYDHPGVHEAAVFGLAHERLGEEVAAVVRPLPDAVLDVDELRRHVASRLASFKVPAQIVLTDEALPRNAAGKFLKRDLRDRLGAGRQQ